MAKCGCAGDSCGCRIVAGHGVRVTGAGTLNSPYVIDAYPMSLAVVDSPTVDLTLTGKGSTTDPWVVSATVAGGAFDAYWTRWVGTEAERVALGTYDADTLYAVVGP